VKRSCIFLTLMPLALATYSAVASGSTPSPPARATVFHTVELRKTAVGKVLVNPAGSILYEFTKDPKNKDTCVKISGCSQAWDPMPVQGKPSAGPGVRASLLSTVELAGDETQVTYAGHPLYIFAAAPTAPSYVGAKEFGGTWYAVNAKGQAVK
jgi:predicted lipoprotein with Yx(FWY)xxD motif